jgi:hypothetical protein
MALSRVEIDPDMEGLAPTPEEVATVFAGLLREMRAAVPFIRPDERPLLRRIMAEPSGDLTVADLFPSFERESAAHTALRRLRTAQFIIPQGRDIWERDQRIAIKPFARLVWDRLGEAAIFGDGAGPTAPVKPASNPWQDDDIMDFLQDTPD